MGTYIDLKKLSLGELVGVVNLYPWFGGARKELCARMSRMGETLSDSQCADAALYVVARDKVAALKKTSDNANWTDADVEELLRSYLSEKVEPAVEQESVNVQSEKKVYVVGGDFFSQAEYEKVRRTEDNVFSRHASKPKPSVSVAPIKAESEMCFYTETLAQIYAEQGYYDQAKEIYSKLILAYPEKSAYFAALITEFDKINS